MDENKTMLPDGWKLTEKATCFALTRDNECIANFVGPDAETNAAKIARILAASEAGAVPWFECDAATPMSDIRVLVAGTMDGPHDWRVKTGYYSAETRTWHVDLASWKPIKWAHLPQPDATSSPPVAADPNASDIREALDWIEDAAKDARNGVLVDREMAIIRAALAAAPASVLSQYSYQQLFNAIAAATSAPYKGAVNVSVIDFRAALSRQPSAPASADEIADAFDCFRAALRHCTTNDAIDHVVGVLEHRIRAALAAAKP